MAVDSVNPYASLGLGQSEKKTQEKDQGELALEDFMALMTAQMQNQDPLKPMESGDFLGQIAQFGTVSGISDLQESFDGFAQSVQSEQALQGSALIGRSVLLPSSYAELSSGGEIVGKAEISSRSTNVMVQIFNDKNEVVETQYVEADDTGIIDGTIDFSWNGIKNNGEAAEAGTYEIKVTGIPVGQRERESFNTTVVAKVESVVVSGQQGLIMNVEGIGAVPFSKAQEII